jgi:hypothetical protein
MEPEGMASMVGYRLKNTVSAHGTVTRGVCISENGLLKAVRETYKIRLFPDGTIRDTAASEAGLPLDADSLVSMNLWGFSPWIFQMLDGYFAEFLRKLEPDDVKSECVLPVMIDALIQSGALSVSALQTGATWCGITYQEDKQAVAAELKKLHEAGIYPAKLYES